MSALEHKSHWMYHHQTCRFTVYDKSWSPVVLLLAVWILLWILDIFQDSLPKDIGRKLTFAILQHISARYERIFKKMEKWGMAQGPLPLFCPN